MQVALRQRELLQGKCEGVSATERVHLVDESEVVNWQDPPS